MGAALVVPRWVHAQSNIGTRHDSLEAFVGDWTATNADERSPYLTITLKERDGKLVGTMTRCSLRVVGSGTLVGDQRMPGELVISDLTVNRGDLFFTWTMNSPFQGSQARLVLEGTRIAPLILLVSADANRKIVAANPTASGLNPVIPLSRAPESAQATRAGGDATTNRPSTSQNWEVGSMARLINIAEVQYKAAHGQYADYPTLLGSGQLRETGAHEFTVLPGNLRQGGSAAEADPLPGFSFRLSVSADKQSYGLSMRERATRVCAYEVFTDDTGIISETHPLGCPRTSHQSASWDLVLEHSSMSTVGESTGWVGSPYFCFTGVPLAVLRIIASAIN